MKQLTVLSVVGARPNFMKMAPVLGQLSLHAQVRSYLVHTGQHYDHAMSHVFFHDLGIRKPDHLLEIGSGTHATQTAKCMRRFEEVCGAVKPDLVIVAGDVNSTLACALTATKLCIPVAHIEAGLRSFDRTMPEEINRIVTDAVADLLFTTEQSANENLLREGVPDTKIHFVGNTMIDSLLRCTRTLDQIDGTARSELTNNGRFFLATIHRPSNVDTPEKLLDVLDILRNVSRLLPVFFVTHPRTRDRLHNLQTDMKLTSLNGGVREIEAGCIYLLPPLPYLEFLSVLTKCAAVLTDSGGIQEETTYLNIPCLTLRGNTERPVTVKLGSNEIVGLDKGRISTALSNIVQGRWKKASPPPLWDGHAAERIMAVLAKSFELE